jgi:predicted DNA-binding transcriptional regulator YafY
MPLSFAEALKKDISRLTFISEQEKKAPKRKPKRVGKTPAYGTLYALRNTRMAIREAALRMVQIIIVYKKETTGETKRYIVCPYSMRYRRLKTGIKKLLFAYDVDDKHIKGFVIGNIKKVALTDRRFRPMWSVEFA